MKTQSGFTIIELFVVMIVLAIVSAIGIPGLAQLIRGGQMTSHANGVLGAVQLARSEASARGVPVAVCGSSDGAQCDGEWGQGWLVFADPARTGNPAASTATVIMLGDGSAALSDVSGGLVRFAPSAVLDTGSETTISMARGTCGSEKRRVITLAPGGRTTLSEAEC
ncbi:GspH/FimT family pseudopilin [Isoalcanivorax pacificus]|nr:GspH/FimT family pseudopilin [Isoalcanivorax pacificus]